MPLDEPPEDLQPFVQGALTASAFTQGQAKVVDANKLAELVKIMRESDLRYAEDTLLVQAHILNSVFNDLMQRSAKRLSGAIPHANIQGTEVYLRLALKAQNQCRATLEALARLKNPPVVVGQQTNIQVNNGSKD